MESSLQKPTLKEMVDAIIHSPTGEIDENASPIESYTAIGTNALKGYLDYVNTTTTTRTITA